MTTLKAREVAADMHTTFEIVKAAIIDGSLPIGFVTRRKGSTQDRIIIVKERYEAWKRGLDLNGN